MRDKESARRNLLLMRVFVSPNGDAASKFATMVREFPDIWSGRVLDIGCRSQQLKQVLPRQTKKYLGVDLSPPADVVANLGIGLPLDEGSSDTVVALDVLEHTDDIYRSFAELCRVSQKYVLIALPNLYEITIRKRVLFGQEISGKYGLPIDPPKDRHRWMFSFREAEIFMHAMAKKCGFVVAAEACLSVAGEMLWEYETWSMCFRIFFPSRTSHCLRGKATKETRGWETIV